MAKCAWRVLQLRQTRHALQGGTFKPGQVWAGTAKQPGPMPSSGTDLMAGIGELYGSTPGICSNLAWTVQAAPGCLPHASTHALQGQPQIDDHLWRWTYLQSWQVHDRRISSKNLCNNKKTVLSWNCIVLDV